VTRALSPCPACEREPSHWKRLGEPTLEDTCVVECTMPGHSVRAFGSTLAIANRRWEKIAGPAAREKAGKK
jgi:hypothetical protein